MSGVDCACAYAIQTYTVQNHVYHVTMYCTSGCLMSGSSFFGVPFSLGVKCLLQPRYLMSPVLLTISLTATSVLMSPGRWEM